MFQSNLHEFQAMVQKYADKNKMILVIFVDLSYIEMGFNLYETSLKKFNIDNYIYVTCSRKATDALKVI